MPSKLEIIKSFYNLKPQKIQVIKSGIINESFLIYHGKKKFVFRIYRQGHKKLRDIQKELTLCRKLYGGGLPVPKVHSDIKGREIVRFKSKKKTQYGVMFEYLPGRHLKPTDTSMINNVAKSQAKMHLMLRERSPNGSDNFLRNLINSVNYESRLANKKLKAKKEISLLNRLQHIKAEIVGELRLNSKPISNLPKGYCHLDYDSTNILTDSKRISGIIDFDDMMVAPFIADAAFSLWWWLFFNDRDKGITNRYLKSYEKIRSLNKKELRYLYLFIRARNLFLISILFINQEKIEESKIRKAMTLENLMKSGYDKSSLASISLKTIKSGFTLKEDRRKVLQK